MPRPLSLTWLLEKRRIIMLFLLLGANSSLSPWGNHLDQALAKPSSATYLFPGSDWLSHRIHAPRS